MRPAARLQATIDILDEVERGIQLRGAPADMIVASYVRSRRYIGSKDRRAITAEVYEIIRRRGLHVWRLSVADTAVDGRSLLLSHLKMNAPELIALFGSEGSHSPEPLSKREKAALDKLPDTLDGAPLMASHEVPTCVEQGLKIRFGDDFDVAISALNTAAQLDLRTNPTKLEKNIAHHLKEIDEDIEKTEFSPIGYRAKSKVNVSSFDLYKRGAIEIQDEAAQLACYLVDAEPGMSVVDLCAGAGGKSLLISALMENRGQIFAFDTSSKRLSALMPRAQRAGCRNIQTRALPDDGRDRMALLRGFAQKTDRVLVDAPCTGTGTWRRNPDQRWRLSEAAIEEFASIQKKLLGEAADMVRDGGRLIYTTCSLLPQENEEIVGGFIDTNRAAGWQLVDYRHVWQHRLPGNAPLSLSQIPECLQLVPHKHRTDGFFVAILEKNPLS